MEYSSKPPEEKCIKKSGHGDVKNSLLCVLYASIGIDACWESNQEKALGRQVSPARVKNAHIWTKRARFGQRGHCLPAAETKRQKRTEPITTKHTSVVATKEIESPVLFKRGKSKRNGKPRTKYRRSLIFLEESRHQVPQPRPPRKQPSSSCT